MTSPKFISLTDSIIFHPMSLPLEIDLVQIVTTLTLKVKTAFVFYLSPKYDNILSILNMM